MTRFFGPAVLVVMLTGSAYADNDDGMTLIDTAMDDVSSDENTPDDATPSDGRASHAPPPHETSEQRLSVTTDGSVLSRYQRRIGQMNGAERDIAALRARLGVHTAHVPIGPRATMAVHIVPQAVGAFTGSGASNTTGQAIHLHNGFVELAFADERVELDVGRFTMMYGEGLMIGSGGWSLRGRPHDGFRLRTRFDNGITIDGFTTMLREAATAGQVAESAAPMPEPDLWMAAVYARLGGAIACLDALDIYEFARVMPTRTQDGVTVDGALEATTGARAVASTGPVEYRIEGGVQYGHRPLVGTEVAARAWQIDADLSVTIFRDRLRLTAGGFYVTGDDPNTSDVDEGWSEYYPSGHRWLGFMNVVRPRTNVRGAVGRVTARIGPRVEWFEHVHWFQHAVAVDGDHALGTEFDTGIAVHAGDHLTFAAEYDVFVPSTTGDAVIRYTEIGLQGRF